MCFMQNSCCFPSWRSGHTANNSFKVSNQCFVQMQTCVWALFNCVWFCSPIFMGNLFICKKNNSKFTAAISLKLFGFQ